MSALYLISLPLLWAQANPANANPPPVQVPRLPFNAEWVTTFKWLYLSGDPTFTTNDLMGGVLTWLKAMSLLCLVSWVVAWMVIGLKERVLGQGRWYDYLGLAALILTPLVVMLRVLETVERIPVYTVPFGSFIPGDRDYWPCCAFFCTWPGSKWRSGAPFDGSAAAFDVLVLIGVHLGFIFGLAAGVFFQQQGFLSLIVAPNVTLTWREGLIFGARMSLTYMGYVVFLRVALLLLRELIALRGRRLYSIARLSIYEANRRMWAPWVVITVFLLVLAFTHWFLQPPRPAEMGRLYVGTLTLLCSVLLTVMVTILTPLSLPTDIQQQTIYTVVSKPVRRLELIWGRMIGYMALVTVLVAIFGGISLLYLWRTVGTAIRTTEALAIRAKKENRLTEFKLLTEQADQLRTRMQARVPVKGSLSFIDSRGTPHAMGIDVGQDQNMKEPRSHIEGATQSAAIWSFGIVPDPFSPPGRPPIPIDRRIPVSDFLHPNTIEWYLDRVYQLDAQIDAAKDEKAASNLPTSRVGQLDASIARNQAERERVLSEYEAKRKDAADLETKAAQAETAGDTQEAIRLRREAAALSSPPVIGGNEL